MEILDNRLISVPSYISHQKSFYTIETICAPLNV